MLVLGNNQKEMGRRGNYYCTFGFTLLWTHESTTRHYSPQMSLLAMEMTVLFCFDKKWLNESGLAATVLFFPTQWHSGLGCEVLASLLYRVICTVGEGLFFILVLEGIDLCLCRRSKEKLCL